MRITSLALCAVFTVSLASPLLTGCAHSRTTVEQPTATVGQQLEDLDKAYKNGTITQKEYEKLKKAIIKKND
jgi:hypothetical protein